MVEDSKAADLSEIRIEKMIDPKKIKEYWDNQAREYRADPRATIKDHQFRLLEMDVLKRHLTLEDVVLDVGCGNGFQTLDYAKCVRSIRGLDYSAPMIEVARKSAEASGQRNCSFEVGDILNHKLQREAYDAVVCERCLINLPTEEHQRRAVVRMHGALKYGGRLLLSEVTLQGRERLNQLRREFGLGDIKKHWHNLYIDEERFLPFLSDFFDTVEVVRFGMYQFISKVIHPMLVAPKEPDFDAKINEVARRIGGTVINFRDASHQVTFVLKKK